LIPPLPALPGLGLVGFPLFSISSTSISPRYDFTIKFEPAIQHDGQYDAMRFDARATGLDFPPPPGVPHGTDAKEVCFLRVLVHGDAVDDE
ncbi:hypothetical protein HK098_005675, partial [Nowakowskiella sp. JEL0407]